MNKGAAEIMFFAVLLLLFDGSGRGFVAEKYRIGYWCDGVGMCDVCGRLFSA
jgi:hypothetical protein